jgi:hypothetical protein
MLIHYRDSQQCASKLKRKMWRINWWSCEENHIFEKKITSITRKIKMHHHTTMFAHKIVTKTLSANVKMIFEGGCQTTFKSSLL